MLSRRTLAVCVGACALVVGTGTAGLADRDLPDIPAHRHYVLVGGDASVPGSGTRVPIGPDLCADPTNQGLQRAFSQFHANIHNLVPPVPGEQTPVNDAMDHEHNPNDITASRC